MTLKQFGYLAAGLGVAFLVFTTLATVQPIIAWPIIIISALLGVAFAFLPIQERPLDHWVAAFFRAIFKPTSLKYSSKIINPQDPLFNKRLSHYIKTYKYEEAKRHAPLGNPRLLATAISPQAPAAPAVKPLMPQAQTGQKKTSFMDKFKAGQTSFGAPATEHLAANAPIQATAQVAPSALKTAPVSVSRPQPSPVAPQAPQLQAQVFETLPSLDASAPKTAPVVSQPIAVTPQLLPSQPAPQPQTPKPTTPDILKPSELKKTVELAEEAQKIQQEIVKVEASLSLIKDQAAQPGIDPKSYIEQFEDLLTQLQKLNEKASKTAQQLAEVSKTEMATPQNIEAARAQSVAVPVKAQSIPTLKLTGFPNVINGIVTDAQGNYIEGAIVVAHDKQGLPVRALKSNKLGQFVAATPLPNGEYAIVVEKESLSFDKVGIELKNEVLPPILMAAKKMQMAA
jgi:hypothetical protein